MLTLNLLIKNIDISFQKKASVITGTGETYLVSGKLPVINFGYFLSDPYMADDKHPDCMTAVDASGNIVPFPADEENTIRPVFYIDCKYLCSLFECTEEDIHTAAEYIPSVTDSSSADDEDAERNTDASAEPQAGFVVPYGESHVVVFGSESSETCDAPADTYGGLPVVREEKGVQRIGSAVIPKQHLHRHHEYRDLSDATNFLEALQSMSDAENEQDSQTVLLTGENGKKIRVRTNPGTGSYSIYNNDESSEFSDYSILYRNDDDNYEQLAGEFEKMHITVAKFMSASVVKDRQTVSFDDMRKIMASIQNRW